MTAKEIIKILKKDGWVEKNCKGSHKQFVHPEKPGKVTVPYHSGDLDIRRSQYLIRRGFKPCLIVRCLSFSSLIL